MSSSVPEAAAAVKISLSSAERRVVGALAGIYMTRMLGLFLLLPVLAIYAMTLPGATPVLMGIAMGAYGFAQAIFQIPFGRWSDRYGRRPLIFIGLVLFLAGSVVGGLADSIGLVIAARLLQGAGAMSAAVTALLADYTREAVRTRAMAFIGISIGASFVVSLISAPLLEALWGVRGIFWIMAALALAAMALLRFVVPPDIRDPSRHAAERTPLLVVGALPSLRPHFVGVFALHFILTATFLVVPLVLLNDLGIGEAAHWKVYLGVFLASFTCTVPLILAAERVAAPVRIVIAAILVGALAQGWMGFAHEGRWPLLIAFSVFFGVFNFLEARLPAALSKAAPLAERGTAMGVFATCQFLGAACGGALGGVLLGHFGVSGVFGASATAALLWAGAVAQASKRSSA